MEPLEKGIYNYSSFNDEKYRSIYFNKKCRYLGMLLNHYDMGLRNHGRDWDYAYHYQVYIKKHCNKTAGGANTNKNGLSFEKKTEITNKYYDETVIKKDNKKYKQICFHNSNKIFISLSKSQLFKYIPPVTQLIGHGCKRPDECYLNEIQKKIFIIEKKYQTRGGSVCEKLQTSGFKKWNYSKLYPEYDAIYIYVLSEWFFKNCKAEIYYLKNIEKTPVFNGDSPKFIENIIQFLIN
jgi:hypothetical protein